MTEYPFDCIWFWIAEISVTAFSIGFLIWAHFQPLDPNIKDG